MVTNNARTGSRKPGPGAAQGWPEPGKQTCPSPTLLPGSGLVGNARHDVHGGLLDRRGSALDGGRMAARVLGRLRSASARWPGIVRRSRRPAVFVAHVDLCSAVDLEIAFFTVTGQAADLRRVSSVTVWGCLGQRRPNTATNDQFFIARTLVNRTKEGHREGERDQHQRTDDPEDGLVGGPHLRIAQTPSPGPLLPTDRCGRHAGTWRRAPRR